MNAFKAFLFSVLALMLSPASNRLLQPKNIRVLSVKLFFIHFYTSLYWLWFFVNLFKEEIKADILKLSLLFDYINM